MFTPIFLCLIGLSLFINAGKQATGETYWALVILLLILVLLVKNKKFILPRCIFTLMILTTIGFVLSAVFSQSIGYTTSVFMRLIIGFSIFIIFYSLTTAKNIEVYTKGLIILGTFASVLGLFFRVFPNQSGFLPAMDLIFSATGHNQGVYLTIVILPIIVQRLILHPTRGMKAILIIFITTIIFSFARAAWIITILYLFYILIYRKHQISKEFRNLFLMFTGLLILMLFAVIFIQQSPVSLRQKVQNQLPRIISIQLIKFPLSQESRFANWREAVEGFIANPFFGTGPGTYAITSARYMQFYYQEATYAHNFYLQTLSEYGVIGSLPLFVLIYFIFKNLGDVRRKISQGSDIKSAYPLGIIDGIFLIFIYGLVEYNLEYLTLWLLVWAGIGLTYKSGQLKENIRANIFLGAISLLLFIFAFTNLFGDFLWSHNQKQLGFYLTAFRGERTKAFLQYQVDSHLTLNQKDENLINFFHRENSDINVQLAQISLASSRDQTAEKYFLKSLSEHRFNKEAYVGYFRYLITHNRQKEARAIFTNLITSFLKAKKMPPDILRLLLDPKILPYYNQDMADLLNEPKQAENIASKNLYVLGLKLLDIYPEDTEKLWIVSAAINPVWDSYHLELASLYLYTFKDPTKALNVLKHCETIFEPRESCVYYEKNLDKLHLPGYYEKRILAIPGVLDL